MRTQSRSQSLVPFDQRSENESSRFLPQARRIVGSGDENDAYDTWNLQKSSSCKATSSVACRTGGLAGPARYTKARAKCENEREALSQNHPPVVTPLFMLLPFAWRTVCADWLLYITWSSNVFFSKT